MKYFKINDKTKWNNLLYTVYILGVALAYNLFLPSNYTGRRLDEEGLNYLLDMRRMTFHAVIYDDRTDSFVAQFNFWTDAHDDEDEYITGHINLINLDNIEEEPSGDIKFEVSGRTQIIYQDHYINLNINHGTDNTYEIYPEDEYQYFNDTAIYTALGLDDYRYPIRIVDIYCPSARNIMQDYKNEQGRNLFAQTHTIKPQDGSHEEEDDVLTVQMNESYNIEDLRLFITENNLTSLN